MSITYCDAMLDLRARAPGFGTHVVLWLQAKIAERAQRKRERAEQREQRRLLRRKEREKKKAEHNRKLEEQ